MRIKSIFDKIAYTKRLQAKHILSALLALIILGAFFPLPANAAWQLSSGDTPTPTPVPKTIVMPTPTPTPAEILKGLINTPYLLVEDHELGAGLETLSLRLRNLADSDIVDVEIMLTSHSFNQENDNSHYYVFSETSALLKGTVDTFTWDLEDLDLAGAVAIEIQLESIVLASDPESPVYLDDKSAFISIPKAAQVTAVPEATPVATPAPLTDLAVSTLEATHVCLDWNNPDGEKCTIIWYPTLPGDRRYSDEAYDSYDIYGLMADTAYTVEVSSTNGGTLTTSFTTPIAAQYSSDGYTRTNVKITSAQSSAQDPTGQNWNYVNAISVSLMEQLLSDGYGIFMTVDYTCRKTSYEKERTTQAWVLQSPSGKIYSEYNNSASYTDGTWTSVYTWYPLEELLTLCLKQGDLTKGTYTVKWYAENAVFAQSKFELR